MSTKLNYLLRGSLSTFALLSLLPGCGTALEAEGEAPSMETIVSDAQYMRALYDKSGATGAMKIDLADDRQFEFLKHRLRGSGLTVETAPAIFSRISMQRERALALQGNGEIRETAQALNGNDRCDMFIVAEQLDATIFKTKARSSCINGADYSYVDQVQYDDNNNVLAYNAVEEWAGGVNTDVDLVSTPPTTPTWADGVTYQLTDTTEEFYYFATPKYTNHLGPTAVELGLTMSAPADANGNGEIRVCLERGTSSADCEYKHTTSGACAGNALCDNANNPAFPVWPMPYNNNRLYVPLQGANTTPSVPNAMVISSARLWLTLATAGDTTPAGGFCQTDLTNSPYLKLIQANPMRKSIRIEPFAPDIGNGLWPNHCVDHRQAVDVHIEIHTKDPVYNTEGPSFAWSTDTIGKYVSIWWGCLPPGTGITMANGSHVPVERLKIGDKVMSDEHGRALTIVDVITGTEKKPLVHVIDDHGDALRVTSTHPIPLVGNQILQARDLMIGDRIWTQAGPASVAKIVTEDYSGAVYNLMLGTPEELREINAEKTTMYANGVLVGDARMQSLIKQRVDEVATNKLKQQRLERLPAAFRGDYERSLERQRNRKQGTR